MKMKSSMALILMGVGGTVLYQQIKNGNARRYINKMEHFKKKTLDDLEDMM